MDPTHRLPLTDCTHRLYSSFLWSEMRQELLTHRERTDTVREGQLSRKLEPVLRTLALKYEEPTRVDRLRAVQAEADLAATVIRQVGMRLCKDVIVVWGQEVDRPVSSIVGCDMGGGGRGTH
jgi:hypothetical protein